MIHQAVSGKSINPLQTLAESTIPKRIDELSLLVYSDLGVLLDEAFFLEWRVLLRAQILEERKRSCEICCSSNSPLEFHHGILTRKDAMCAKWVNMIDVKENLFLLCEKCHKPQPPSRHVCWEMACRRYGRTQVENWYLNIPYKLKKPPRYF
jgi:hypothetical protein